MSVPRSDRYQIEGLQRARSSTDEGDVGFTAEQQSSRAVAQLASNPPPEVGSLQRRTARWLLRP
eukprot:5527145-Prymnesium_polylepis.2